MQFAEIGGLTADEIENVQSEYQGILEQGYFILKIRLRVSSPNAHLR
jgi:hypothetical protein